MLRGGSWNNDNPDNFRATYRNNNNPTNSNNNYGFRCVSRSPGPPIPQVGRAGIPSTTVSGSVQGESMRVMARSRILGTNIQPSGGDW